MLKWIGLGFGGLIVLSVFGCARDEPAPRSGTAARSDLWPMARAAISALRGTEEA